MINNKKELELSKLSDEELETYFVKKVYKFNEKDISVTQFLFWFIYYTERRVTDLFFKKILHKFIIDKDNSVKKVVDDIVDELNFNGKIKVLRKNSVKLKELCKYLEKINDIRNQLFHNRKIEEIKYDGKKVLKRTTKEKMIKDLFEILRNTI